MLQWKAFGLIGIALLLTALVNYILDDTKGIVVVGIIYLFASFIDALICPKKEI